MKNRLFDIIAALATQHPKKTLAGLLLFTLAMIGAASTLTMEMSQMSLMPENNPVTKEFEHISKHFSGATNTITIAVHAKDKSKLPAAIEKTAKALQPLLDKGRITRMQYEMPRNFMQHHGMMLQKVKDLNNMEPQTRNLNLVPFLTAFNDNLEKTFVGGEDKMSGANEQAAVSSLETIDKLLRGMERELTAEKQSDPVRTRELVEDFWLGDPWFLSANRHWALVYAQPRYNMMDSIFKTIEVVEEMDSVLAVAENKMEGVFIGMTGMPVIQKDEMNATTRDSAVSTVVAFVLIIILLIVSFRVKTAPILAGAALVTGIIWAAGMAGLLVGRLNITTAFFAVYLVGLGIDFCIHYIHGYNEQKSAGLSPAEAVGAALRTNGGSIVTGGFTTAFAFLALVLTDAPMYQEMGLVAGIGVLGCVFSALLILPSVLFLLDKRRLNNGSYSAPVQNISEARTVAVWSGAMASNRKWMLPLLVIVLGISAWYAPKFDFNSNMLDMEPKGLESVELQDTILNVFDQSTESMLFTVSSLDSAWHYTEILEDERLVGSVLSPSQVCPPDSEQQKRAAVLQIMRKNLDNPAESEAPDPGRFLSEMERLEANIIEMSQSAYLSQQDRIVRRADRITGLDSNGNKVRPGRFTPLYALLDNTPQDTLKNKLGGFQSIFKPLSEKILYDMSNPEKITWEMVPQQFQDQFYSPSSGEYLITVMPRYDVWEDMMNNPFLKMSERLIPNQTGTLSIMKVIFIQGKEEGRKAILFSLLAISLILFLHFRKKPLLALLAMLPMISALIILVGLYSITGVPLNMMSMMALPLIVGIGVDDGVHICHRFMLEKGKPVTAFMGKVGHAVLLTTLTTMIAFGSLVFGEMPANVSMGFLLLWGVALCYLTSVTLLPVAFGFFRKSKESETKAS